MTFVTLPIARNNWAHIARLSGFCCHVWLRLEVSTRVMFTGSLIKFLTFPVKVVFSALCWPSFMSCTCQWITHCTASLLLSPREDGVKSSLPCSLASVNMSSSFHAFTHCHPTGIQNFRRSPSIPLFIPWFLRLLKNSQPLLSENIMIPVQVKKQTNKKKVSTPGAGRGGCFHNDLGRALHLSSYLVACSDRTPWTQMCFAIQSCVLWSRQEDWGLSWHSFQELTYYYYQNSGFPLKCLFLQIK